MPCIALVRLRRVRPKRRQAIAISGGAAFRDGPSAAFTVRDHAFRAQCVGEIATVAEVCPGLFNVGGAGSNPVGSIARDVGSVVVGGARTARRTGAFLNPLFSAAGGGVSELRVSVAPAGRCENCIRRRLTSCRARWCARVARAVLSGGLRRLSLRFLFF